MMNIEDKANNPVFAANCFLQGVKLLSKTELRKFIIIPVFINLLLYSIALALAYNYISDLITQFIPAWLFWLEWLIWPVFFISFFITGFFTFTVLANLMAAPFYSRLAAKTQDLVSGDTDSIEELPVHRVIISELKRAVYLLSRMLPLLILFIIPGINIIAPLLWAFFGAWGMALEFMAYPLENQGLLFSEQKQKAKQRRFGVLGFGGIIVIGLTIPVINLVVAPAAVIGATIYLHAISEK